MQCGQSRDACFFKVRQSGGLGLPKGAKLARFAYAQKFNPIPEVKKPIVGSCRYFALRPGYWSERT